MEYDFYVKNVKVEGFVLVQGGDSNIVVFEDLVLKDVNVDKSDVYVFLVGSIYV